MFDFNYVLDFIKEINKDCEKIISFRENANSSYNKEKATLEKEAEEMVLDMRRSLISFTENNISPVIEEFNKVIDCLALDYAEEANGLEVDACEFEDLSLEESNKELANIVNELNERISTLNAVDFDALVPPVKIQMEGDTFYTYTEEGGKLNTYTYQSDISTGKAAKPLTESVKQIFALCQKGKACAKQIERAYEKTIDVEAYELYVRTALREWEETLLLEKENRCEAESYKLLDSSEAKAKYDAFFDDMKIAARKAEVNPETGTLTDSEEILIGRTRIKAASEPSHELLISKSTSLCKYLEGGYISAPVILDLKKCGNILLELDEEEYGDNAKRFIEQVIIKFLLAFPPAKIKFRLIDTTDKVGFSAFKMLTKINTDTLLDGIIRDDRKLEDAIRDMEQLMYNVDENKLSYNNVSDIFEYNRAFETNPQDLHLFVLTDFPNGIHENLAQRILNIIQRGNKAGIFTLLVYNRAVKPDYNFDKYKAENIIEKIKKYALNVKQGYSGLALNMDEEYPLVIDENFSANKLPSIIEVLQHNAESTKQKNVLLDTMFSETERVANSIKGILPAAEVIDVPIGVRGGEIQTLMLETNGGVSPHAVIIGGTGSGKSNLLHTIILSTCYRYSPEEVNLYLIDFKGGTGFKFYEANKVIEKQIPHIKLTGLTSDVEDGMAILNNLQNVLADRQEKFRKANVSDNIVQYCQAGYKMPRLFVIVDEFQEFFEQDDNLGQKAVDILSKLFKEGRGFGITILWASQNIPNFPGLRDKVISQIGNRISLKLNEPDDAEVIKINSEMVRALNRPEKGLGIIKDSRTGNDSVEFRVAYAENVVNRQKYAELIIDKWKGFVNRDENEPLYIVGDDTSPSPIANNSVFAIAPSKSSIVSKAFVPYNVQFGVNYITGKPFEMNIELRANKSNIVFMGTDIEAIRDMMGYSLLSVILEHITNADCAAEPAKIYYANGEGIKPNNSEDLFNVAKEDFSEVVENVSASNLFKDAVKTLYKVYKARQEESDNLNEAKAYAPYFFVIHSLQRYIGLFESNPVFNLNDDNATESPVNIGTGNASMIFGLQGAGFGSSANSSNPDSVAFVDAFKELMSRAGQFGIHFIISLDSPDAISSIRTELYGFNYKVFAKGINATVVSQVLGTYSNNTINNPEVALVAVNDEKYKVRMYRYDNEIDTAWYNELVRKYQELRR